MLMLASVTGVLKYPLWTGHMSCAPAKGERVMVRPTGKIGRLSEKQPSIHSWFKKKKKRVKANSGRF